MRKKLPRLTKPLPPGKGAGAGRPPELVDDARTRETIKAGAQMQGTQAEIAAMLGVRRETFNRFLAKHPEAKQAWDDGLEAGKLVLRRNQWKIGETNAQMAIWLGKQYLGQRDQIDLSGPGGGPIETKSHEDNFDRIAALLDGVAGGKAGGHYRKTDVAGEGSSGAASA